MYIYEAVHRAFGGLVFHLFVTLFIIDVKKNVKKNKFHPFINLFFFISFVLHFL